MSLTQEISRGTDRTTGRKWQLKAPLSAIQRYASAVITVSLAVGVALLAERYNLRHLEFPLLLLPIILTAWYAGPRPGMVAVVLSGFAFGYFFEPPFHSFYVANSGLPRWFAFILFGSLIVCFSAVRRRAEQNSRKARDQLELEVVKELSRPAC